MTEIFISYSQKDREFATRLAADLRQAGIDPFYDQVIEPGESWAASLMAAISRSRYVIVVLSPDAVQSEWVKKEVQIGLWRESQGEATVIPLLHRPCVLPELLATKRYANFTEDYSVGLAELLQALKGSADAQTRGTAGTLKEAIRKSELAKLREALNEAVAQFKAIPSRKVPSAAPFASAVDTRKCFVVMPFCDEDLQVVYEDFVRPAVQDVCGLYCERGDDVFGSNVIMDDIQNSIATAGIVLADLTGKNANVFYEVGICHALDKPVLLIAQSMDDVPFDLRHRRVLISEYTPRGVKRLEKALADHLNAMLQKAETGGLGGEHKAV